MTKSGQPEKEKNVSKFENHGNYFGGCPSCGGSTGYFNIGRDHWFYCDKHKTRWLVGSNLFSSWRNEDEQKWSQNRQTFKNYAEVEPLPDLDAAFTEHQRAMRHTKAVADKAAGHAKSREENEAVWWWWFENGLRLKGLAIVKCIETEEEERRREQAFAGLQLALTALANVVRLPDGNCPF